MRPQCCHDIGNSEGRRCNPDVVDLIVRNGYKAHHFERPAIEYRDHCGTEGTNFADDGIARLTESDVHMFVADC